MQIIEVNPNQIKLNPEFIEKNLTELIKQSDYNLNIIMELIEILKDSHKKETITILKDHYIFHELKETINKTLPDKSKKETIINKLSYDLIFMGIISSTLSKLNYNYAKNKTINYDEIKYILNHWNITPDNKKERLTKEKQLIETLNKTYEKKLNETITQLKEL